MTIIDKITKLTDLEKNILATAQKEFESRGFYETNVDKIALSLDIGKGTIYRHFGNKLMLFISVIIYIFHRAWQSLEQLQEIEPFENKFETIIDQIIKTSFSAGSFIRVFMEEQFHHQEELHKDKNIHVIYNYFLKERDKIVLFLKDVIEAGKIEGKIPAHIDALFYADVSMMLINHFYQSYQSISAIRGKIGIKGRYSLETGFDELHKYIYNALGYKGKRSLE